MGAWGVPLPTPTTERPQGNTAVLCNVPRCPAPTLGRRLAAWRLGGQLRRPSIAPALKIRIDAQIAAKMPSLRCALVRWGASAAGLPPRATVGGFVLQEAHSPEHAQP